MNSALPRCCTDDLFAWGTWWRIYWQHRQTLKCNSLSSILVSYSAHFLARPARNVCHGFAALLLRTAIERVNYSKLHERSLQNLQFYRHWRQLRITIFFFHREFNVKGWFLSLQASYTFKRWWLKPFTELNSKAVVSDSIIKTNNAVHWIVSS